jgi:hypothetical protein
MVCQLRPPGLFIEGKYNHSKAVLLITLYLYKHIYHTPVLSITKLKDATGLTLGYLYARLPVFAGNRAYYITGKKWKHRYLKKCNIKSNGCNVLSYMLTNYGENWVNNLSIELFTEITEDLKTKWSERPLIPNNILY